jgi:hypothetical protein
LINNLRIKRKESGHSVRESGDSKVNKRIKIAAVGHHYDAN